MKIFGITKIRSEEKIISYTLDQWGKVCTGGIFVVDEESEDRTIEICRTHHSVRGITRVPWNRDREMAECRCRQTALEMAQRVAEPDDWIVYFDADEILYWPQLDFLFDKNIGAVACWLYDIYITPEDVDKDYTEREWVGPEYRTIPFFFRNSPALKYDKPDQRIVDLAPGTNVAMGGIVKHYGKGFSVEEWEKKCDYYIDHWPKYAEKWKKRKGKAVHHYISDFGNPLIKFNDVLEGKVEGIPLEIQPYGRN